MPTPTRLTCTPDRRLLNPDFEGYQVSFDASAGSVTTYPIPSPGFAIMTLPRDVVVSYGEVHARATFNHLSSSPDGTRHLFIDAAHSVWQVQSDADGASEDVLTPAFALPPAVAASGEPTKGECSIQALPSVQHVGNLVFASKGDGWLHVADALTLRLLPPVALDASEYDLPSPSPFSIISASAVHTASPLSYKALILVSCTSIGPSPLIKVFLLGVDIRVKSVKMSILWGVESPEAPIYAHIHPMTGVALLGSTVGVFNMIHSTGKAASDEGPAKGDTPIPSTSLVIDLPYVWRQEPGEIIVEMDVPVGEEVDLTIGGDTVGIQRGGAVMPVIVPLYDRVSGNSAWTREGEKVILRLEKLTDQLRWPHVWRVDDGILEEGLASVPMDASPLPGTSLATSLGITSLQDEMDEDEDDPLLPVFQLYTVDGTLTSTIITGGQSWLGKAMIPLGDIADAPGFCLRRDVDGLVYAPRLTASGPGGQATLSIQHVDSINAFGYIRASKTDARFVLSLGSPARGVIIDGERRVYIYHRGQENAPLGTQHIASLTPGGVHGWGYDPKSQRLVILTDEHIQLVALT